MDDVYVVVPVYNEATTLQTTIRDLLTTFAHVVCVDDGSTDGSSDIAHAAGAVVITHPVNLGQGAAVQTGFDYVLRHTSAAHVVTFDGDGQHRVSDALAMLEVCRHGEFDVVLASRFLGRTENMPLARNLMLRAAVWFSRRTTGLELTDTHNGLRVLSRNALLGIKLRQPRMAYASELEGSISSLGLRYVEVPATVVYSAYSRAKGQRNSNALNIVFDLAVARLRPLS